MKLRLVLSLLFLTLAPAALASTTWFVDGVNGSDSNDCTSATTGCKTIGHAINLAASGDSIMVAPATYSENLMIRFSLNIAGASASTTIIDGGGVATVVFITAGQVTLSGVTIRNGLNSGGGGGIGTNAGTSVQILNSVISGNSAQFGGGIENGGAMGITNSIISGNTASEFGGGGVDIGGLFASLTINKSTISGNSAVEGGGGISGGGPCTLTSNNSTISGNSASSGPGGGIDSVCGVTTITNSTISGNTASVGTSGSQNAGRGGGLYFEGPNFNLNNSTISGNSVNGTGASGGGIYLFAHSVTTLTLQNSIVADNPSGGNCAGNGTFISNGYNLSSDNTCNFTGTGDLNDINPKLGPLQNNGGPSQTMALGAGSPAIDAGNPSGCTDNHGILLKSDQRGAPRPDKEDTGGCDLGAFESQSD
jgi:hypothetical protein